MTTLSTPGPAAPQVRLPAAGCYRVDPARSSASFTTRQLFGLRKVTGSLALLAGQVAVAADPAAATVYATFASDSLRSASDSREEAVKYPRFLDVDSHPHLTKVTGLAVRHLQLQLSAVATRT